MQIHWKPKAEVTCILCGEEQPSLLHVQLDCSKLEEVRDAWQEWLAQLSLGQRPYLAYPIAPQLSTEQELRLIRQNTSFALPEHQTNRGAVTVWTDGSANVTLNHVLREATWAIVMDTCASDIERSQSMRHWNTEFRLPDTFEVVQVGFVPGRQTVNRAELLACVLRHSLLPSGAKSSHIL